MVCVVNNRTLYLVKSNFIKEAITICQILFDIKCSSEKYKPYKHLFISDWTFNEKIKLFYSQIESCEVKIRFSELLCNKLNKCMEYEIDDEKKRKFSDDSCVWRKKIAKIT